MVLRILSVEQTQKFWFRFTKLCRVPTEIPLDFTLSTLISIQNYAALFFNISINI
jgi:hypothetical protein